MFVALGQNGWTKDWWQALRVLLGVYIYVHFASLVPWAAELFSNEGMLPDASASPIFAAFPSVFHLSDSPLMATALVGVGALCGAAITLNRSPRAAAAIAWYVIACSIGRNPLILNPALPHVGWLLLYFAAVRGPESQTPWRLPREFFTAAWMLMGTAMTWSAVSKFGSASWIDGTALHWVWANPLARDTALREALLSAPMWVAKAGTWGALFIELLALPAALFPRLRPYVWTGLLFMHLGLLATVNFSDLTFGMLIVHAALFDPHWLPWATRAKHGAF